MVKGGSHFAGVFESKSSFGSFSMNVESYPDSIDLLTFSIWMALVLNIRDADSSWCALAFAAGVGYRNSLSA